MKLSDVWSESLNLIQKKLKIGDFSGYKLKYKDGNEFMNIADGNGSPTILIFGFRR